MSKVFRAKLLAALKKMHHTLEFYGKSAGLAGPKAFQSLMGTYPLPNGWGRFRTMPKGERERLWTILPGHPIARGLDDCFEIPQDEMYGEPFLFPQPDNLVFLGWLEGGEAVRAGCEWQRGRGKVFLFTPGHEEFPIFFQAEVQRVMINAVRYLCPPGGALPREGMSEHRDGSPREDLSHRM